MDSDRTGSSRALRWGFLLIGFAACSSSSNAPVEPRDGQADAVDASDDQTAVDAGTGAEDKDRDAGSGADATVVAFVCDVQNVTSCPTPPVKYGDVKPIFDRHCNTCHSSQWTGPWPLTEYEDVSDWQDDIRTDVLNCSMPMADGGVPVTITNEERQKILSFIVCGLPQ